MLTKVKNITSYVTIGTADQPLATEEPGTEDYLPTTDNSWDKGVRHLNSPLLLFRLGSLTTAQEMTANTPLYLSSPASLPASPFARLCQASHLLGRVLRHHHDTKLEPSFRYEEASQLSRTIQALIALLPVEPPPSLPEGILHKTTAECPLSAATGVAFSAALTLYDVYSCISSFEQPDSPQVLLQEQAISGLKATAAQVVEFVESMSAVLDQAGQDEELDVLNIFIFDALYQAAANYAWLVREAGQRETREGLETIRSFLRRMEGRWKVAGELHCGE